MPPCSTQSSAFSRNFQRGIYSFGLKAGGVGYAHDDCTESSFQTASIRVSSS